MEIESEKNLIKLYLSSDYRVALVYNIDNIIDAEYHFIYDKNNVSCCMCFSSISDPLEICGVNFEMDKFLSLLTKNNITSYALKHKKTLVYPKDWFPCFDSKEVLESKLAESLNDMTSIKNNYKIEQAQPQINMTPNTISTFSQRMSELLGL
jgi:hypothetical protein